MVLLMAFQENYRKSFIRNNRVKKISNEPVAVTMKWNGPLVPLAPRLERETRDRGNN